MKSVLGLVTLLLTLPAFAGQIVVSGKCRKKVKPDRASLTLNVDVLAPNAVDAQKKASAIATDLIKSLKKLEYKDVELSTGNLSLNEDFVYEDNKQRSRGFRATNSITLTTSEIDRIAQAVPAALRAGAKSLGGLAIFLSEDAYDKNYQECLAGALANAREKAQKTLGAQKVGELLDLVEEGAQIAPPAPMFAQAERMMMKGGAEMESASPPIEARDTTVESKVTAKFKF